MSENFNKQLLESSNNTAAPSINPLQYPSVLCDQCGGETFVPGYVFKKIPGVVLGKGAEEQILPIEVCVCSKCGELMPEYKAKSKKDEIAAKTNLII